MRHKLYTAGTRIQGLLLALIIALPFQAAAAKPSADKAAEDFIAGLGHKTIQILSNETLNTEDRIVHFQNLFIDTMAIRKIARFALGQYARIPTPQEREEYIDLIKQFILKVYAVRLSEFADQTFDVTGSRKKGSRGREVIVSSRIDFQTGREPVPVEWWLLLTRDGDYKVFDVNVLGVWMAQEQRSVFVSVIRNNGGKFSALLDHLRNRIAQQQNSTGNNTAKAESLPR